MQIHSVLWTDEQMQLQLQGLKFTRLQSMELENLRQAISFYDSGWSLTLFITPNAIDRVFNYLCNLCIYFYSLWIIVYFLCIYFVKVLCSHTLYISLLKPLYFREYNLIIYVFLWLSSLYFCDYNLCISVIIICISVIIIFVFLWI